MTAGQSAAGRDVESINEEAVEAMVLLTEKCSRRDCGSRVRYGELTDDENTHWHVQPGASLVRLSGVPGLERQLRDKIAGEAQSKLEAMSTANPPITGRGQAFDAGWRACCHIIARGESS